jgi:hypothetical protein
LKALKLRGVEATPETQHLLAIFSRVAARLRYRSYDADS